MSTKFNQCPNCQRKPSRGFLGSTSTEIQECKQCGTIFCYKNCGSRCPDCGSTDKRKVGYCMSN